MPQETFSSPPPIPQPSTTIIPELKTLRDSLHLIFHRNRNQHRRSGWWRSLAGFRRAIQQLLANMEVLSAPLQLCKSEDVRPLIEKRSVAERSVRAQLSVWRDGLAERWYSLVASSQFSSLGLVLLSALARSSSLLGVTSAIQTQGKKITNPHLNVAAEKERTNYTPRHQGYDEYGEVVERYSVENLPTTRKTFTGVTHKSDTSETRQCDERSHSSIQHSEGKITKYRDSEIDILGNLEHIDDKAQSSNEPRSHTEGDEIDMLFEGLA